MIISFIKVGLMIGLTSIGGSIYQTLKNAQEYKIKDEELIIENPIKLLIDYKKENDELGNNINIVDVEKIQGKNDKIIDKEYI